MLLNLFFYRTAYGYYDVDRINFQTTLQSFLAVGSLFQKEVDSGCFFPKGVCRIDVPDHIASGDILSVRPLKIRSE